MFDAHFLFIDYNKPMLSDQFFKNTKDKPPSRILLEALSYTDIQNYTIALDLGCGAFRDTRFLLEKGLAVDAVDNDARVVELVPEYKNLHFYNQSFQDFTYPVGRYDIVNAQYSLPFCAPEHFPQVWEKIVLSLKTGGLFAGQFFGPEDGFAPKQSMTFLDKSQVEKLFVNFDIHTFVEAKRTKPTATGRQKSWHVFDVIATTKFP